MVNDLYSTKRLILGRGPPGAMPENVLFNGLKEHILECGFAKDQTAGYSPHKKGQRCPSEGPR